MIQQLAFSGTQAGMTPLQRRQFGIVFESITDANTWVHHGDCIGADAEVHAWVIASRMNIHIHPSLLTAKRAWCQGAHLHSIALPPLDRNRLMVDDCEALIAAPRLMIEELRSGTWATIRYARKQKKPVHIVWPDGSYSPPAPK